MFDAHRAVIGGTRTLSFGIRPHRVQLIEQGFLHWYPSDIDVFDFGVLVRLGSGRLCAPVVVEWHETRWRHFAGTGHLPTDAHVTESGFIGCDGWLHLIGDVEVANVGGGRYRCRCCSWGISVGRIQKSVQREHSERASIR